jgi:DNA-binding response OmpR family regulator
MILVEADEDLAACVSSYFSSCFEVVHLSDVSAITSELERAPADVILADVDPGDATELAAIADLRRRCAATRFVLTYPAGESQGRARARLRGLANVCVRKPYRVSEIACHLDAIE